MIYEYAGYSGPPEMEAETHFSWTEDFSRALREEFMQCGGTYYSAAAGGCSFVARISDKETGETRLLKVPQRQESAQAMGRAERATLKLLATTVPSSPFAVPRLLREQDDPQHFVITEVPGEVLTRNDRFTDNEQYLLGRDTGKLAVWEARIDTVAFKSTVPLYEGWNWVRRFADL